MKASDTKAKYFVHWRNLTLGTRAALEPQRGKKTVTVLPLVMFHCQVRTEYHQTPTLLSEEPFAAMEGRLQCKDLIYLRDP